MSEKEDKFEEEVQKLIREAPVGAPIRIPVELDRRRHFLLNMVSVARFEQTTGKAFWSKRTWDHLSGKETAVILWACLVHEDPGLTPAAVARMFAGRKIDEKQAARQLSAAWAILINSLSEGK